MPTFNKDIVNGYGSLDAFAKADGCFRIYESDSGFHTVRKPADEDGILSSPYLKNLRLVWERGQGSVGVPVAETKKNKPRQEKKTQSRVTRKSQTIPKRFKIITHLISAFLPGALFILILLPMFFQISNSTLQAIETILGELLGLGLYAFILYALAGGLEWKNEKLPLVRLVIFWILGAGVYGLIFWGVWLLVRKIMAKIYDIPFQVAKGRLLNNNQQSKKSSIQPAESLSDECLQIFSSWIHTAHPIPADNKLKNFMNYFAHAWHVSWRKGTSDQVYDWFKNCAARDFNSQLIGRYKTIEIIAKYGLDVPYQKHEIAIDPPPDFWESYGVVGSAIEICVAGAYHVIGKASEEEFYYLAHQ